MALIDEKSRKFLAERFSKELKGEVTILLFKGSADKCAYCNEAEEIAKELTEIDSKIKLTVYDIDKNAKEAKFLGVDSVPAMLFVGKKFYNAYYFGLPSGYEFASLIDDIIDVSAGTTKLNDNIKEGLSKISKKAEIKVFVTPTCPYCPRAVRIAHQFAIENPNIKSSMIEAMEFPELSNRYEVMAVPKIVINDKVSFEGAGSEQQFLEQLNKALQ